MIESIPDLPLISSGTIDMRRNPNHIPAWISDTIASCARDIKLLYSYRRSPFCNLRVGSGDDRTWGAPPPCALILLKPGSHPIFRVTDRTYTTIVDPHVHCFGCLYNSKATPPIDSKLEIKYRY